jgi:signal transduction histidine kinase
MEASGETEPRAHVRPRRPGRLGARGLGDLLLLLFAMTVLSFLASTALSLGRARGISKAAIDIATNVAPSIEHLSNARTELRHSEIALDDYVDAVIAKEDAGALERTVHESIDRAGREWGIYKSLPAFPGETALWRSVESRRARLNAAVDELLRRAKAGDGDAAQAALDGQVKPDVNEVDDALLATINFSAQQAARLGSVVDTLRRSAKTWLAILEPLSVLLSIVAAITATIVVRRYSRLMELRVEELEHFAGRVAHDIRSPLSSVALTLDVAKRTSSSYEKAYPQLDRARGTLQRVNQLVDGLLVFARSGGAPSGGKVANVHEVLKGVIDEMRPIAAEKDIAVELDDARSSTAACSAGVLTSLVSNLVGNAVKYMGDATDRHVMVRAHDVGSRLRVEVEDTGPGVPPDQRDRIFQMYERAAGSTQPGGLGLGLATVRRLAESHGGAAGLETPSVGSRFWFELPREKEEAPARGPRRLWLEVRRAAR